MIDNRTIKENDHEIEEALSKITDTEILLNFQKAITSIYPHLIPIHSFAYDSWDDIVEPLFFEMVYNTFSYKYGITIKSKQTHTYNVLVSNYRGINHIECIPKHPSVNVLILDEWVVMNTCTLVDKVLVFKSFGDGIHFLTGGLDVKKANKVSFELVEIDIICAETRDISEISIFIYKEDLDFIFVAET